MSEIVLETHQLTKQFGKLTAVNQLDLKIKKGMVFGLLGPNGSGKTTTLGMLLGVTRPTSGTFSWNEKGYSHQVRKKIGSILEHPVFYPYMSGYQNLELATLIKEVSNDRIDEVLEVVGLLERKNDKFKNYSLGMKQRLAIASALLSDPTVLVLDEPTNGLDPQGIFDVRQLIIKIAETGKTILLASHLLDEVQKVCTHFCVLREGSLIHQGSVEEDFSKQLKIEVAAEDMSKLESALGELEMVQYVRSDSGRLIVKGSEQLNSLTLNKALVNRGIVLSHLNTQKKSLEEQFIEILKENNA